MVGGEDDFDGGRSNDSEVESLVDLVKLLHNSDNPLWELVRFEVREREKGGGGVQHSIVHACTNVAANVA